MALGIVELHGDFAVDGGNKHIVVFHENGVQELGKSILKLSDGGLGQRTADGGLEGRIRFFEIQGSPEGVPAFLDPAADVSDVKAFRRSARGRSFYDRNT